MFDFKEKYPLVDEDLKRIDTKTSPNEAIELTAGERALELILLEEGDRVAGRSCEHQARHAFMRLAEAAADVLAEVKTWEMDIPAPLGRSLGQMTQVLEQMGVKVYG